MENPTEQVARFQGKRKTDYLEELPEIAEELRRFGPELLMRKMRYSDFYRDRILPLLEPDLNIPVMIFTTWAKKKMIQLGVEPDPEVVMSLMDREVEKQKRQIEIRQDATDLMGNWLKVLRALVDDPNNLKKYNGQQIMALYKIIRDEEDRSKALNLRERAEDRADASFAFLVSIARAGELQETDIEFLSDDIKKELLILKQDNGIYKLPSDRGLVRQVTLAAKDLDPVADGGDPEGAA